MEAERKKSKPRASENKADFDITDEMIEKLALETELLLSQDRTAD